MVPIDPYARGSPDTISERVDACIYCRDKCARPPAPHFRPIRHPHIANYSSEAGLNEPRAFMPVCPSGTGNRVYFQVTQSSDVGPVNCYLSASAKLSLKGDPWEEQEEL
jgi:hypothetical protein